VISGNKAGNGLTPFFRALALSLALFLPLILPRTPTHNAHSKSAVELAHKGCFGESSVLTLQAAVRVPAPKSQITL